MKKKTAKQKRLRKRKAKLNTLPVGAGWVLGDPLSFDSIEELILASNGIFVNHFGAVGDGETDDSAAIQAALNYAKESQAKEQP